jgi:uncharacterized protein YndB with AHSA1/START domain
MTLTPIEDGTGTTMTVVSTFPSREAMEQMIAMGMQEGATEAANQMDAIVAELVAADAS